MAFVMVADDDESVRAALKLHLESLGHQVALVADGMEVAEQAQNLRPALLVCDVHMPNVYGTTAYSVLQRNPLTAHIPVLFLTGLPLEKVRQILPKSPRVRLLAKPLDHKAFDAAVAELLKKEG